MQLSDEIVETLARAREAVAEVAALADPAGVLVVKYQLDPKSRADLSRTAWRLANKLEAMIRGGRHVA